MEPTRLRRADDEDVTSPPASRESPTPFAMGEFEFRTIGEGRSLATLLARAFPDPERVEIGLTELLVNAVEHGNLGITGDEKCALLERGELGIEIERRLAQPELSARRVRVTVWRTDETIVAAIADEGSGFDWHEWIDRDAPESLSLDPNGRGILIARALSFDRLDYNERGNVVTAAVELTPMSGTRAKHV